MKVKWTSWQKFGTPAGTNGPGVYKIRLLARGKPQTIPRFLGQDPSGLLSIGVSGNLERRLRDFLRGLDKGRGHSEANLLNLLRTHASLERKVGPYSFQYSYKSYNHKKALALESMLIKQYVKRFGEVPPLNSAIPDRYNSAFWEKDF